MLLAVLQITLDLLDFAGSQDTVSPNVIRFYTGRECRSLYVQCLGMTVS